MVQGVEFGGFRVYGAGLGGQPASYELRMHPDSAQPDPRIQSSSKLRVATVVACDALHHMHPNGSSL